MEKKNFGNSSIGIPNSNSKGYLIALLIAVLLIAGVWFFKSIQLNKIKENAQDEITSVREGAAREILAKQEENLRIMAKPFVWALRPEMMRKNYSQINLYLKDIIKEEPIRLVAVVNNKGKIVAGTNKKNEGKPFSTVGEESYLNNERTSVVRKNDSTLVLSSPIMGFNNRLGTLYLEYKLEKNTTY